MTGARGWGMLICLGDAEMGPYLLVARRERGLEPRPTLRKEDGARFGRRMLHSFAEAYSFDLFFSDEGLVVEADAGGFEDGIGDGTACGW